MLADYPTFGFNKTKTYSCRYIQLSKMKFIFTFLILLPFLQAYGQNKNREDIQLSIHTTPLTLIDTYSGMYIGLGGEIKIYKNLSANITAGYYTNSETKRLIYSENCVPLLYGKTSNNWH
ncbi:MAG: hypothetical protein COB15_17305 [Flavobacteriales bacterium]|nr:MAG: hypothetical protein COB15_17305 [Flavobacteriales bacterium]